MPISDKKLLKKISILYVEDNLVIRKEISHLLEKKMKNFFLAENGKQGLEFYKKYKPDLVLSDVRMPKMDGLEMSRKIKNNDPNIPIIVMTAFDEKEYLLKALEIGIDGYILKPINYDILLRSILKSAKQLFQNQEILRLNDLLNKNLKNLNEKTVYLDNILLYSTDMAIVATDLDFYIKYFNPMAVKMYGFKQDEIIGTKVPEMFSKNRHEYSELSDAMEAVREKGHYSHTLEIENEDGTRFYESRVSSILDKESNLIGFVFMSRDVTEQSKMEDELNRMQRLESVGTLAGGLAHDFNNLLTTIMGNIGLTKLSLPPQDDSYRNLSEAENACSQARNLTSRFLTFSRGGTPFFKTVAILDFLPDYIDLALSGTNVNSEYLLSDEIWPVKIDENQISQVIQNIITNSIEAMPKGGKITINAENVKIDKGNNTALEPGKYVKIEITDQGKGISKENLPHIFDPYFSTKEKGSQKGMGLGLSICYSIILKHKGIITADSQENKGTTIHLFLPSSNSPMEEDKMQTSKKMNNRVLLMDDDTMVLDVASRMLSHLGFDSMTAKDGEEAFELYSQAFEIGQPFDVVILDLTIKGGMGGEETVKKLINFDPSVTALVSSGYTSDPIISNYQKYGFKGIVAKPYNIKELEEKIKNIINN